MFAKAFPILVVSAVGVAVVVFKVRERRRLAKVKASGGRKSLVLNILQRP
jgi:hypothetical protein